MTQAAQTLWESELPLVLLNRGKVRDIYAFEKDLVIVTSDRLSAFDYVLPNPIPFKGAVLNQTSLFWFDFFKDVIPHHLVTADVSQMRFSEDFLKKYKSSLDGRSMLVKKANPFPVECVVRGYITGSGWKDYLETGTVCGHKLPKGLQQCDKLPKPIFTPATKAQTGHDENISFDEVVHLIGREKAERLRDISIELYQKGSEYAEAKGILIADTKFEFGEVDGEIILIDEALTPDSSRFWPKDTYEPGHDQPSFDKQIVRNYLLEIQWNKQPPVPQLPDWVVEKTSNAYREIYQKLTGKSLGYV